MDRIHFDKLAANAELVNTYNLFYLYSSFLQSSVSQPESADSNESAESSGCVRKHYRSNRVCFNAVKQ